MKKTTFILLIFVAGITAYGQTNKKLAQTGLKFLNVATDPRAVAMGEAFTSIEGGSTAMFFNPAGLARFAGNAHASFGSTQWIAGINHLYASAAVNTPNGDYGVFGITFQSVDYGDLLRTVRADNSDGYMDVGTFRPNALAIGLGYARALSDRFAIGGRASYVYQDLGGGFLNVDKNGNPLKSDNTVDVVSFDFGMFYKTGFKSLNFAMSVRNFSKEIKYQKEGFQLPLMFRIGVSVNAMDFVSETADADPFLLTVDATNSRDYPETINIGGEYIFFKTLAIRGGYMFGQDEHDYTAGIGVQQTIEGIGVAIDYAYTPFGVFGTVNRFAIQLSL
ncbi:MAG: PorV/PorQ family protein [Ignavibacteriales bacterium]|nr:PorV/PorQ family protein [Ignavibacteriales bacterium]